MTKKEFIESFNEWFNPFDEKMATSKVEAVRAAWDYQQSKIEKLEQAVEILRESNGYYKEYKNWTCSQIDAPLNESFILNDTTRKPHSVAIVGGKRAREAERRVKEILDE